MSFTIDAGLERVARQQVFTLPEWAEDTGVQLRTLQRRVQAAQLTPCGARGRHPVYERRVLEFLDGVA